MNSFFDDEYSIEETKDFHEKVESIFPAGQWDSAIFALHWKLQRDPTLNAHRIDGSRWVMMLDSQPKLVVFYTIDEDSRVVTLTDVRGRSASPLAGPPVCRRALAARVRVLLS